MSNQLENFRLVKLVGPVMDDGVKAKFMQLAVESAWEGVQKKEGGPFGACVVRNGEVLSVAHNTVLLQKDATCHAEINAIRLASEKAGQFHLKDVELYTTAEPCPMCLAAAAWARIPVIYAGVDRHVVGEFGFDDDRFYGELDFHGFKNLIRMEIGILRDECRNIFVEWKKMGGSLY